MREYRLFETHRFAVDLWTPVRSGHRGVLDRLAQVVYQQLRRDPRGAPGSRKLPNYAPETWQYCVGPWRLFYEIDDEERIVFLIAATHRSPAS